MDQKIRISEVKVTAGARTKINRRGHIGLAADSKLRGIAQALMHPRGDRLPHPTQGDTAKLRLRAARGRGRGCGADSRALRGCPLHIFARDTPAGARTHHARKLDAAFGGELARDRAYPPSAFA